MAIERTSPLWIHKRFVMHRLAEEPESLAETFPSWRGTVSELLNFLREDEREWFVGSEFMSDAEAHARYPL